ncbi:hypothetical protein LI90_1352 [Carbonactinospora thermoautotrophica]|uniref:Uncharacterized protein n=1 Tax=Carbonactinospora thermoautotrophica TaxID=1469144 RepID=A0A132MPI8_9ACTN|nr:hypothetical protein LI90_1352 [Carbonactinospora thermoautotrophica]
MSGSPTIPKARPLLCDRDPHLRTGTAGTARTIRRQSLSRTVEAAGYHR